MLYDSPVEIVGELEHGEVVTFRHGEADPQSIVAKWVVACDGAHSAVRRALGVEFIGEVRARPMVTLFTRCSCRG